MNIIKFKDIILKPNNPLSEKDTEFFNSKLKGKYAYWIQGNYVVSLEDITEIDFYKYELHPELLNDDNVPYLNISFSDLNSGDYEFINNPLTNSVNDIHPLLVSNAQVPVESLTIGDIKRFRAWLAESLLSFDQDPDGNQLCEMYTPEVLHMLQYYANGMYDEVIKYLSMFDDPINNKHIPTGCSCGCGGMTPQYTYDINTSTKVCNPIAIYRENIYKLMVTTFTNTGFWSVLDKIFLKNFKLYIDCIIAAGLPLSSVKYETAFQLSSSMISDCGCGMSNIDNKFINILHNLSTSLEYIINDDIVGHKNFINQSFNDWATLLYEKMSWIINSGDDIVISPCCPQTYTKSEIDAYIDYLES